MRHQPSSFLAPLAAALLMGAALAQPLPTGATQLAPERYLDVPERHWAVDAIRRLSVLGVLTGYPDENFRGDRPATRYELAVVAARLVDLIGGSLADLALDPAFWSDVERVAEMLGRVRRVESALENAASVASVQALGRRVADIEAYLNESVGEERFPLDPESHEGIPVSAADTVPPLPEASPGRRVPAAAPAASPAGGAPQDRFGVASPQQRRPLEWWIGIAAGYPLPATVHVGIRDLVPSLHLRGGGGFSMGAGFGLELQLLYSFPVGVDAPVLPYLGAGPLLRGGPAGAAGGILAFAGIEVPLGRSLSEPGLIYLELGPESVFRNGVELGLLGRAGIGYRF
ncbi:MAG: S-layer homology domain-containing protein [Trueperaceae bacterium]